MSECLIGNAVNWSDGLPIVNKNKIQKVDNSIDFKKKFSRLVILNDIEKARRIVLVVDLVLGIVNNQREGEILISQHFPERKIRLTEFYITYPFITET